VTKRAKRSPYTRERRVASSRQAMLDGETRSLLAAAEAFLRSTDA
jgi:hypothetical protein